MTLITQKILLLPGWAIDVESLAPLRNLLARCIPGFSVSLCPLPPLEMDTAITIDDWMHRLGQHLGLDHPVADTPDLWLCGWSLGGMLAVALAQRFPDRIAGIITLAANARFTAAEEWPEAMPSSTFEAFAHSYRQHPEKTLKRFALLCSQGCPSPSQQAKTLATWITPAKVPQAGSAYHDYGLGLLAMLDNRTALASLECPHLHMLADNDALVPRTVQQAFTAMGISNLHTCLLTNNGHAFPLSNPRETAAHIAEFIVSCP